MNYKKLTFGKLISRNELRALIGWRYQALIFLSTILFITFLCFGFANNARKLVSNLSKDPLSNWINIKFTGKSESALLQLQHELEEGQMKDTFMIRNADFYTSASFSFLDKSHAIGDVYDYRTIDPDSPIVEDLVNEMNLMHKYYPGKVSDILKTMPEGIIVTRNILEQLGFGRENVHYLFLDVKAADSASREVIVLPVVAVVKGLPEQVDVVCTNSFLCNKTAGFGIQSSAALKILVENMDSKQAIAVRDEIKDLLKIEYAGNIGITRDTVSDSVQVIRFDIPDEGLQIPVREKFFLLAKNIPLLAEKNCGFYSEFELDPDCDRQGHWQDYLAVDFQRLDKIRDFDTYIKENFGVSMNMETLIQRENYLFLGNLALASILMVIVFCVFSLTLYISETFKNHILKVKKNLGNLMALGASNNELISLYLKVALKMLLYAIFIAYILSVITGELFEKFVLGRLIVLQENQDYFNLMNLRLVLFIILIVIIALLMTYQTIKRILKVSPGDLIYERDSAGQAREGSRTGKRSCPGKIM